jgi:hypothetical protein
MMEFDEWCEATDEVVNGHDLTVLSGSDDHLVDAQDKVAAIVPAHYASEEHVAHVLVRLGKAAAAEFGRLFCCLFTSYSSGKSKSALRKHNLNILYEIGHRITKRDSQLGAAGRAEN